MGKTWFDLSTRGFDVGHIYPTRELHGSTQICTDPQRTRFDPFSTLITTVVFITGSA